MTFGVAVGKEGDILVGMTVGRKVFEGFLHSSDSRGVRDTLWARLKEQPAASSK